jgi:hypothetical protein
MAMKGIELPVNVLVIIVIAVIVIIALVALLTGGIPLLGPVQVSAVFNAGCTSLQDAGCMDSSAIHVNLDVNSDKIIDEKDTLLGLCQTKYGAIDDAACKKLCKCPGT